MIKMSDKQNINEMSLKDVWHDKKLVKNEIIAGTTGFFAIMYVIFVNP